MEGRVWCNPIRSGRGRIGKAATPRSGGFQPPQRERRIELAAEQQGELLKKQNDMALQIALGAEDGKPPQEVISSFVKFDFDGQLRQILACSQPSPARPGWP